VPAARQPPAIALLAVAAFVSGANLRIADPLIPKLADEFAVTVGGAASVVSGFTLAYALFQIVHGPLGDRIGKLRAVAIGMFIAAAASLACAAAPSLGLLVLGRFLTGMGAAAVIPLSFAYIGDQVPYERRQLVMGRFIGAVLSGQVFGPLLGGALSQYLSWRLGFVAIGAVFAVVGLRLLPAARHAAPTMPVRAPNPLVQYARLARDPWVRVVVLTVAAEGFLFYGAFAYLGAYLASAFGLGYLLIGLTLAGFSIGGVVYSLLVGRLLPRLRERGLAAAGGSLLLICFLGIALAPSWPLSVPFFVASGLAFYMLHNTLQTRATEMAPRARGAGVSFFAFSLFVGQAAGVAAFGTGIERIGYAPLFVAAGMGLALLAAWFRRRLPA
jgi:predicted MFS family arabinose efflux permease